MPLAVNFGVARVVPPMEGSTVMHRGIEIVDQTIPGESIGAPLRLVVRAGAGCGARLRGRWMRCWVFGLEEFELHSGHHIGHTGFGLHRW